MSIWVLRNVSKVECAITQRSLSTRANQLCMQAGSITASPRFRRFRYAVLYRNCIKGCAVTCKLYQCEELLRAIGSVLPL